MPLLVSYSFRNIAARKLTSLLTIGGIALVVFVFCAMLMLSSGLEKTLVDTGSADNAMVIRQSSNTEIVSIIDREMADIIRTDPAIATSTSGEAMVASEILVLINLRKRSNDEPSNVPVRGVDAKSIEIRPAVKLTAGRMWTPGTSEIIAGVKVAGNFKGCGIGETVRFGMRDWTIVGTFEAGNSGFESELWGDLDQLMAAFERPVFSSLTFRLTSQAEFEAMKKRLESDKRLTVELLKEQDYYRRQSETFSTFITILGTMVSFFFACGATVGAMITMYASVSNRTKEIGTLRALGFSQGSVLIAFLIESLMIATLGGLIGIGLAALLRAFEISTTNFDTFAEVAFSFHMTPIIAASALVFALAMGFIGGFLPAMQAARLKIISALRAR